MRVPWNKVVQVSGMASHSLMSVDIVGSLTERRPFSVEKKDQFDNDVSTASMVPHTLDDVFLVSGDY